MLDRIPAGTGRLDRRMSSQSNDPTVGYLGCARRDNTQGWVTDLGRDLEASLNHYIPVPCRIELLGPWSADHHPIKPIAVATHYIPILSRAFFASDWCREELELHVARISHPLARIFPVRIDVPDPKAEADFPDLDRLRAYRF